MALNNDFRVKNSLYVGSSACFVTCTDSPRILSGGTDLWDIFLQEGENATSCVLSNGSGIAALTYDGLSATTISLDSTCESEWNGTTTTVRANSADWAVGSTDNLNGASTYAQGTVTLSAIDDTTIDLDLGLETTDSPLFAGVTAGCVTVGVSNDNTITTSNGDLTIDSAGGQTTIADNTCITGALDISGLGTGTDNTVLIQSTSGQIVTDEIDGRVWGSSLVDATGATTNFIPKFCSGNGIVNGPIRTDGNDVYITGGLSAVNTLSGDGSGLTGVTATPTFPTVGATGLTSTDKIFVNDGASCETACNKHITYSNLLADLSGTGLDVEGDDSLALKNASGLTCCTISKWDSAAGMFSDSLISETGLGNITIAGGATITGNLSVQGDLTCIDTLLQTTSAICVVNAGTGPAVYAEQTGAGQPIATFVDTEGGQVVIGDTGDVGIGIIGNDPAEKLTVSGNISANGNAVLDGNLTVDGNTILGDTTGDTVTVNACGIIFGGGLSNIVDNSVLTVDGSGQVGSDEIDGKVWGTDLVDGEGTNNAVPKYTNGTGTIGDSNITDSGSVVTIDSDTAIDSTHYFQIKASASAYSQRQSFTDLISDSGTVVSTFTKTNLRSATYHVTLINGVNITTFDINAVYNGTDPCGTVYGIVDAQAASQLNDIEITDAGSTIELSISSTAASTTAIIEGTALYT